MTINEIVNYLNGIAWGPWMLILLVGIDSISCIVPRTVCDKRYEVHAVSLRIAQQTIHRSHEDSDQIYVLPLVESADIIRLSVFSLMEYEVYRARMILDIQPVADILSLAIYRQFLTETYIIDEQWDKFLRELVWTIIVRAVGDHCRKPVCVMVCSHKMVR